jgi:hypothetical protein
MLLESRAQPVYWLFIPMVSFISLIVHIVTRKGSCSLCLSSWSTEISCCFFLHTLLWDQTGPFKEVWNDLSLPSCCHSLIWAPASLPWHLFNVKFLFFFNVLEFELRTSSTVSLDPCLLSLLWNFYHWATGFLAVSLITDAGPSWPCHDLAHCNQVPSHSGLEDFWVLTSVCILANNTGILLALSPKANLPLLNWY